MQTVKVRRVGNSNVVSLPRDLERYGFAPGALVAVTRMPNGDIRLTPVSLEIVTRERPHVASSLERES